MFRRFVAFGCGVLSVLADGPADNLPNKVRPVPPPGLPIPAEARAELEQGAGELRAALLALEGSANPDVRALAPDVRIFFNAIDYALRYDEFLNGTNDLPNARKLLEQGMERARELAAGKASWTHAAGLVTRGYVSKIDGSVQPYGLVAPPGYAASPERPRRLDAWFHGRDEKLTELKFLSDRQRDPGLFVPPDTFVLHLYGRYCNANKFAGETDLFEALADVKARYRIDEDRVLVRGFSMGGAACWQFAVHYPGEWAAAAPGAGFAETKEFLRVFQNEPVSPPLWEQKLWRWYDCPEYAANLFNLPVVAYSGELDRQRQAAEIMAAALEKEGIELTHIVGPGAGHTYVTKQHDARPEIDARIDALAARGRDPVPRRVKFTTPTLRYHRSHWVALDRLEEHWEPARIEAGLNDAGIEAVTKNIAALTFEFRTGQAPFRQRPVVVLDGQSLDGAPLRSDRSWTARYRKENGRWGAVAQPAADGLVKRPGLQGPIDDAFTDSFIMVQPSGAGLHPETDQWVQAEMRRAIEHWRKQFRGEARVLRDTEVTGEHIASANLVLWGDPVSNQLLARIAAQLPVQWTKEKIHLGGRGFPSKGHAAALIFPNPLNPGRYVVLNSGVTFREYDYLNNARQTPKLPDYAIFDLSTPPDARYAGKVAAAGFFDERWALAR